MERRAVAHAGRHSDNRAVSQSADDTGQRPLHTGDGDDDAGGHDLVQMSQGPVQTCHPHIIEPYHLIAQYLGGEGRLLRHRHIAGAAGSHHNLAQTAGLRQRSQYAHPGLRVILHGMNCRHSLCRLRGHPRDEDRVLPIVPHNLHNPADLLRGLARTVDHFRSSLPNLTVQVHLGITDVLKGRPLDLEQCLIHTHVPGADRLQNLLNLVIHRAPPDPVPPHGSTV